MLKVKAIRTIVYPARDLDASIRAWSSMLGAPVYRTDDVATFLGEDGVDIRLSRTPWADRPLAFWEVEDIEKAYAAMLEDGAIAMGQVEGGMLEEVERPAITNGDLTASIIAVPGRKLAIFKLTDGNLVGLLQDVRSS